MRVYVEGVCAIKSCENEIVKGRYCTRCVEVALCVGHMQIFTLFSTVAASQEPYACTLLQMGEQCMYCH